MWLAFGRCCGAQDSKKAKLPIVDDGGKLIALMSRS
jgi:hypothetical protein